MDVRLLYVEQKLEGFDKMATTPSKNDQKSDVKNPNNNANKCAKDNRADQKNPNNSATKGKK
jgi:hypothetical protein